MNCKYNYNMIKFRLNELMNENGINPKKLYQDLELSGIAKVYVWKKGDNIPNYNHIIKLADYFNCSIEYLLGRTENNSQTKFKDCPPFDAQLKKVMKEKKITQYKLVKDRVVASNHFHKWNKLKEMPSTDTLIKLADYLGVSIDYLVGRE